MDLLPILPRQFNPIPNANLFSYFMAFQDAFTWNVQSGSGSSINTNYNGNRVQRVISNVSTGVTINSGGTQTQKTIDTDGLHYLTFGVAEADLGVINSVAVTVTLFVNATPVNFVFYTLFDAVGKNEFRYFLGELNLSIGDVISYQVSVASSDVGLTYRLFFKAFKLEVANGNPTVYSLPENTLPLKPTANGLYGLRIASGVSTWELLP